MKTSILAKEPCRFKMTTKSLALEKGVYILENAPPPREGYQSRSFGGRNMGGDFRGHLGEKYDKGKIKRRKM
jgi:hypothetical protein